MEVSFKELKTSDCVLSNEKATCQHFAQALAFRVWTVRALTFTGHQRLRQARVLNTLPQFITKAIKTYSLAGNLAWAHLQSCQ